MKTLFFRLIGFWSVLLWSAGLVVAAESFPSKPITIVVPFAPGGATDAVARIYADNMSKTLGQPVVVQNMTGAGGTVGSRYVMRAKPDGTTILIGNLGTHVASLGLFANPGYDPVTDFKAVSLIASIPMFVVAKKSLPVKNFREFVTYLKEHPGQLSYGTAGIGSTAHLTCLYLEKLVGSQAQHVPYAGTGPALSALLGQHIDYVCDAAGAIVPQLQAGAVNGLVVTTRERLTALPDMPTSIEAGYPEFIVYGWIIIFAPKDTPNSVITILGDALAKAAKDPEVRDKILAAGSELPRIQDLGPQAAAKLLNQEIERWIPLMKSAGIRPE